MKGWEPIPSALISDTELSLQTRAVYTVLRHLVWQETRASEETMTAEVGTLEEIARAAGCSETALKTYLAELRDAGWVSLSRKRRGHPYTLTIRSAPASTESESASVASPTLVSTESESGPVQSRNPTHSRERGSSSGSNKTETEGANAPSREPDLIWEILEERFGRVVAKTNAHARRNKAVSDLKRLDATPEAVRYAIERWSFAFDGATLTDIALATHYPQLTAGYEAPMARDNEEAPFDGSALKARARLRDVAQGVTIGLQRSVCRECEVGGGKHADWCTSKRETSSAAYTRFIEETATNPDFSLDEISAVVATWSDLDDVGRSELLELAEQIRRDHNHDTEVAA